MKPGFPKMGKRLVLSKKKTAGKKINLHMFYTNQDVNYELLRNNCDQLYQWRQTILWFIG